MESVGAYWVYPLSGYASNFKHNWLSQAQQAESVYYLTINVQLPQGFIDILSDLKAARDGMSLARTRR